MPRVAYLGPEGTFTEAALLQMAADGAIPGPPVEFSPVPFSSAVPVVASPIIA